MASAQQSILIVDDDDDILTAGRLLLKRHYNPVDTCSDPAQIPERLAAKRYDAILLDMNFGPGASSGEEGFHWLEQILKLDPDAVVVLITAHGGVDVAVQAIKQGATDFVAKPWHNEKLLATLSACMKLSQSRTEAATLKQTNRALIGAAKSGLQPMLGTSPGMAMVRRLLAQAAPTDANVLILGEHGTGKELAARALHEQSQRADEVFMPVDLGSLTDSLFESELFGHVKGAFTDAKQNKTGLMQAAQGGTLFLDEIGNVPLHLQAKLLAALERRQVVPVGAEQSVAIDVRIVAATNATSAQLNDASLFRPDLLFRLNTVEVTLPSLRERSGDIPELVTYYLGHYARKYRREDKPVSAEVMAALTAYSWPGNIRALRHAVERAVILSTSDSYTAADFQLREEPLHQPSALEVSDNLTLEDMEKRAIQRALTQHRYNISHAAKTLGLTRAALYRRMEKHGL